MYFSGFPTFWNEKGLVLSTMALFSISYVIKIHEEFYISPFLMNLRPEFETVKSGTNEFRSVSRLVYLYSRGIMEIYSTPIPAYSC